VLKFFDWAFKNGAPPHRTGLRADAGIGRQAGAGLLESQPEGRFGQGDLVILSSPRGSQL
jgi:hypothetical protein